MFLQGVSAGLVKDRAEHRLFWHLRVGVQIGFMKHGSGYGMVYIITFIQIYNERSGCKLLNVQGDVNRGHLQMLARKSGERSSSGGCLRAITSGVTN